MDNIDEIVLRVCKALNIGGSGAYEKLVIERAIAELSKDAEPVARICSGWQILFIGSNPIADVVRKHDLKIGDGLFTHPAPVIASEQKPECWYDGNRFYANEESASMGCADMANLKPLFTSPPSTADIEQRTAEACEQGKRDAVPEGLIESVARAIYMQWRDAEGYLPWQDGGNSLMQDSARRIADAAIAAAPKQEK